MFAVLMWTLGRMSRGDKPTLWGNMSHPVREQFRRAGRDLIWIPAFFISLAIVIDTIGALMVKEYAWGESRIYAFAVEASIGVWLVREFIRVWWYLFRSHKKEIRVGKRFLIDLREQTQDQSEDSRLIRR